MFPDRQHVPLESHRAYRWLWLLELLLSVVALALWIASAIGLL